jgi:hypothetical protein
MPTELGNEDFNSAFLLVAFTNGHSHLRLVT